MLNTRRFFLGITAIGLPIFLSGRLKSGLSLVEIFQLKKRSLKTSIGHHVVDGFTVSRELRLPFAMSYGEFLRFTESTHNWNVIDSETLKSYLAGDLVGFTFEFSGSCAHSKLTFRNKSSWEKFAQSIGLDCPERSRIANINLLS